MTFCIVLPVAPKVTKMEPILQIKKTEAWWVRRAAPDWISGPPGSAQLLLATLPEEEQERRGDLCGAGVALTILLPNRVTIGTAWTV